MAGSENNEMPGALTSIATAFAGRKSAELALTDVEPPPIGSNATPPPETAVGE